jgi:hypothetical protein
MWPIVWMLPLLAVAGVVLAVAVGVRGDGWPRPVAFAYAAFLAGWAIVLAFYVAGEDDYRGGGISRWDAYDAHPVTVAAIGIGLVAAVALAGAATHGHTGLVVSGFLGSSAAFLLQFIAFLANSLN